MCCRVNNLQERCTQSDNETEVIFSLNSSQLNFIQQNRLFRRNGNSSTTYNVQPLLSLFAILPFCVIYLSFIPNTHSKYAQHGMLE